MLFRMLPPQIGLSVCSELPFPISQCHCWHGLPFQWSFQFLCSILLNFQGLCLQYHIDKLIGLKLAHQKITFHWLFSVKICSERVKRQEWNRTLPIWYLGSWNLSFESLSRYHSPLPTENLQQLQFHWLHILWELRLISDEAKDFHRD